MSTKRKTRKPTPLYKRIIAFSFVTSTAAALQWSVKKYIHPKTPPIITSIPWFLLMGTGSKSNIKTANYLFASMYCLYYGLTIYPIYKLLNYLISNAINPYLQKQNNISINSLPNIKYEYALLWLYSPIIFFESFNKEYFIWRLWLKYGWNYPIIFSIQNNTEYEIVHKI